MAKKAAEMTDNELRDTARAWAALRVDRAAQGYYGYTMHSDGQGNYQLTAPLAQDRETGEMDRKAYCLDAKGNCDCPDYTDRLMPIKRELWKRGFRDEAFALACKHRAMIPHLLALAEEQQQDKQSRERYADDLSSALDAALIEIERLTREVACLREDADLATAALAEAKDEWARAEARVWDNWEKIRAELRLAREDAATWREAAKAWQGDYEAATAGRFKAARTYHETGERDRQRRQKQEAAAA